jgi:hypothetical protein
MLLSLVAQASAPHPAAAVASIGLEDQLGRRDALERHRGRPVLAMVVDAGALRQLRSWELAIRQELPDLDFFRVADVPRDRGITRQKVLDRLEGRVPQEVSILIDMEGRWAGAFELDTSTPNLLLFDADLELAHVFRGRQTPAMVDRVVAAVEALTSAGSDAS